MYQIVVQTDFPGLGLVIRFPSSHSISLIILNVFRRYISDIDLLLVGGGNSNYLIKFTGNLKNTSKKRLKHQQ
jgi:hypothetical protein